MTNVYLVMEAPFGERALVLAVYSNKEDAVAESARLRGEILDMCFYVQEMKLLGMVK